VEGRVDRLGQQERRVLEAASISGAEFATATVAALLDADELDVEACCESLARRDLILDGRDESVWHNRVVSGRYGFHHELYRDVIYERIPPSRRSALHRKLGECLEAGCGGAATEFA